MWNYCTQAWALGKAHTMYHPNPLKGDRLEQFFAEYARTGLELGASQPPTTRAGVDKVLADMAPEMGVTLPTVSFLNPLAPWRYPPHQRPIYSLVYWAVQDIHPEWAKKLMQTPRHTPVGRKLRHAAVKTMLNSMGDGSILEVRQSYERAAANRNPTDEPADSQPALHV